MLCVSGWLRDASIADTIFAEFQNVAQKVPSYWMRGTN